MSKPIFPEAVQPGPHYSFRADMRLNSWALGWEGTFAAIVALYILGNTIFNRRYR